jgi:glycosyltransferase involved in cell wall biosynthesis
MDARRKLISIVTPCFNEADNIEECHAAVRRLFDGELAGYDYEHIFCDNASTDGTLETLRSPAATAASGSSPTPGISGRSAR